MVDTVIHSELHSIRIALDQFITWIDTFAKANPILVIVHLTLFSVAILYLLFHEGPKFEKEAIQQAVQQQIQQQGIPMSAAAGSIASAGAKSAPVSLPPPKNDPISAADLKKYDGSDPSQPVYVAIKGTVFDVSSNKEAYAPGQGYHVFAGKDASKALGKSSLKEEDAIADYSGLDEKELKVLDDWVVFFKKRYPIVGKVA